MAGVVTFVLVGHCGADSYSLSNAVRRAVGDAAIAAADDAAALDRHLGPNCILLVNRVLDGDFDAENGIELIRALAVREPRPVMALISNYADAQDAALAAGAVRGFGKSEIGSPRVTGLLRDWVAAVDARPAPR